MRIEVIPRLLTTVMQTEKAHPLIDVPYQGIVYSLEVI